VCHTELDIIEGRTPPPRLPVIPGHQVVGTIMESGRFLPRSGRLPETQRQAPAFQTGQRVGVAWIASACGRCEFCTSGRENLCPDFAATGRDHDGGYAEYMKVRADFAHPIPASLSDTEAAPLLCAGAIGYRSLRLTAIANDQALGLTGFGGSGHLTLKLVRHLFPDTRVHVLTRNPDEREFARTLGAAWAGAIDAVPPEALDAVIDTTPVWGPGLEALKHLKPGGRLVINGIRKEDTDKHALLGLDYPTQLWMEKEIKSVANVTRQDVREFLALAAEGGIRPEVQEFALADANHALAELRQGSIRGSKVLRMM
jgi:propanol-preferring alcohol dehydrogenase